MTFSLDAYRRNFVLSENNCIYRQFTHSAIFFQHHIFGFDRLLHTVIRLYLHGNRCRVHRSLVAIYHLSLFDLILNENDGNSHHSNKNKAEDEVQQKKETTAKNGAVFIYFVILALVFFHYLLGVAWIHFHYTY